MDSINSTDAKKSCSDVVMKVQQAPVAEGEEAINQLLIP